MTDYNIDDRLVRILREELRQPTLQVSSRTTQSDVLGWDSTAMVSIIMSIEEEFGFEFSAAQLRGVRNVGDLAQIIGIKNR